ncbi:MAG: DoxX family protein [Planctomycetes bacterium]|nr:DoxX family protein [Planctomycetota bacterium]
MASSLIRTNKDYVLALSRIALGLVAFPYGAQKVVPIAALWGGDGFGAAMRVYENTHGLPGFLAGFLILAEFAGGFALLLGLFGRLAAAVVGVVMGLWMILVWDTGWFVHAGPSGQLRHGIEFYVLILALCVPVLLRGSGAFSIDLMVQNASKKG